MRHDHGHFLHCREQLYVRLGLIPRAVKDGDRQYGRIINHAEFVLISNLKPQYNRKPGTRIREFDGMPIINEDISETELIHIKAIL